MLGAQMDWYILASFLFIGCVLVADLAFLAPAVEEHWRPLLGYPDEFQVLLDRLIDPALEQTMIKWFALTLVIGHMLFILYLWFKHEINRAWCNEQDPTSGEERIARQRVERQLRRLSYQPDEGGGPWGSDASMTNSNVTRARRLWKKTKDKARLAGHAASQFARAAPPFLGPRSGRSKYNANSGSGCSRTRGHVGAMQRGRGVASQVNASVEYT